MAFQTAETSRLTTKRLEVPYEPPWDRLPDTILLNIFQYLPFNDLANVSSVCWTWKRVSYDELLWRDTFRRHFNIDKEIEIAHGRRSWREEFIRLHSESPAEELETIYMHSDQVLHVSFSHNGEMFATSSKDGTIKVWNATHPSTLRHDMNMTQFQWKYTQFSQFNETDTLLLVSGVYFGYSSTAGEIAVFSLQPDSASSQADFSLQCRVVNKPYDVFGSWYNDRYLFSGNLYWLGVFHEDDICSCSTISLNYAFQATESENCSVVSKLFKFKNINASTIRTVIIADMVKARAATRNCDQTDDSATSSSSGELNSGKSSGVTNSPEVRNSSVSCDKLMIFTKGYRTYTPHVIGIKRLPEFPYASPSGIVSPPNEENVDYALLRDTDFDRVDRDFEMNGHIIGMCLSPDHRYLYINVRAWPADADIHDAARPPPIAQEIDVRIIDLVTMMFVSKFILEFGFESDSTGWKENDFILAGPPHVVKSKMASMVHRAHRAFTPDDDCFFIFLDVADDYLASGAEDKHAYIWERHYNTLLAKFPHSDVVNSVAFNPKDPEILVTVSDDNTIKVWGSRRRKRQIGILQACETRLAQAMNQPAGFASLDIVPNEEAVEEFLSNAVEVADDEDDDLEALYRDGV